MPTYYPPIVAAATGSESALVLAGQSFGPRHDLTALQLSGVRAFLGLGSGTGSTDPNDSSLIIATQVYGP